VRRPDSLLAVALILAVYVALGLASALTRSPWQDEAWFASPAWNLSHHGFLGTTVLDPASNTWKSVDLTGIDRHTYWVMPLSLLLNSAAFAIFGFHSLAMRLPSLLFGLLFLLAWRAILRRLDAPPGVIAAALLLIAVDFHFQMQAADGRMDAMTASLGYCGIAVYLMWRERRFAAAVLASQALTAAACFTHPNGALTALLLALTTVYLDRKRVGAATVALAAIPYLVLGAAWGIYIAQDPAAFRAQFLGNVAGRGPTITQPLAALKSEIVNRYMNNFGLASWSSLGGRVNVIPLVILLGGTMLCFAVREIRRRPGYRLLLIWTAITICYLTWFEGLKTPFYLIYLTPLYSVLCAVAAGWLWERIPNSRVPVAAALIVLVLLQGIRTLAVAARNPRQRAFAPAVRYLQDHYTPTTFIMGDGSLLFGLGPDWHVLDDFRLGYNTGKRPDVIVIDEAWDDRIGMLREQHPDILEYTRRVLSGYREVYNQNAYRILERSR
jgi:hypothetical protein